MEIKVFYSVLEYFCYRKNMTMSRLCVLAGLNNCCLNKSKTIKTNRWVRVDTFLKLCKALEISPVEFFKEYEKEEKRNG